MEESKKLKELKQELLGIRNGLYLLKIGERLDDPTIEEEKEELWKKLKEVKKEMAMEKIRLREEEKNEEYKRR